MNLDENNNNNNKSVIAHLIINHETSQRINY
jgi:hypothetical protein